MCGKLILIVLALSSTVLAADSEQPRVPQRIYLNVDSHADDIYHVHYHSLACIGDPLEIECIFDQASAARARTGSYCLDADSVQLTTGRLASSMDKINVIVSTENRTCHSKVSYTCSSSAAAADDSNSTTTRSPKTEITFHECPDQKKATIKKPSGSDAQLACSPRREEDYEPWWQLDGFRLSENSYELNLSNLTMSHQGVYRCFMGSNGTMSVRMNAYNLIVE